MYDWTGSTAVTRAYASNGLNQLTTSGAASLSYDARGNLSSDGVTTYGYDVANELTSLSNGTSLTYDAAGRLQQTAGSATTQFLYDGTAMIGEYNGSGGMLRRYVPGLGTDEPIVWYEGSGVSDRRWLIADQRGSVIAVANAAGTTLATNTYDEYGVPGAGNLGRFQYTGQAWIPEAGLYYYKTRAYSPTLGRFMQTDLIGYGDGMNWYAYAHNDPINGRDPSGLCDEGPDDKCSLSNLNYSYTTSLADTPPTDNSTGGTDVAEFTLTATSTIVDEVVVNAGSTNDSSASVATAGGGVSQASSDSSPSESTTPKKTANSNNEVDEVVVKAAKIHYLSGITINFNIPYPQEQLWVLYDLMDIVYLGINGSSKGNIGENRGTPPRDGYKAIIHTHPSWAEYGPGPKDFGHSVPVYGIAPDGVWVIRVGSNIATGIYGQVP